MSEFIHGTTPTTEVHLASTWSNGQLRRKILALGVPLLIGEVGSILQQFADTMMVGHHTTAELAAAGFVNSIFYFVIFLSLGMSYASTPLIASAFGKNDKTRMVKVLFDSLLVNVLVALFFVLSLSGIYMQMEAFHQPSEILNIARSYFIWLILSVPFLTIFNGLKQYMDGIGKTNISMWALVISNAINILLNYCLIFGKFGFPELGLIGAGISTFVARVLQCSILGISVYASVKKLNLHSAEFALCNPTWVGTWHQIKLGLPISIQLGLEIGTFNVCGIFMGWIGVVPLAAHQAMYTMSTICFQVLYAFGAAGSILISQFRGVDQWANLKRAAQQTWIISMAIVTALITTLCVGFECFARLLTNDPEVVKVMWLILPSLAMYQIGDCTQITFANALRGLERTKPLFYIAFFAYCVVSVPLCYFFAFVIDMGVSGVWAGIPIGLTLAGIMFYTCFRKYTKFNLNK